MLGTGTMDSPAKEAYCKGVQSDEGAKRQPGSIHRRRHDGFDECRLVLSRYLARLGLMELSGSFLPFLLLTGHLHALA